MDTAHQWPQEIVVKPMEEIVVQMNNTTSSCSNSKANNNSIGNGSNPPLEKKMMRPQKAQAVGCPRCNSTNTKFCYYNNYSLSQPRYFCKTCRRYWTEGGSLRNIPVGGGSRKNKKSSSMSNPSSSNPPKKLPSLVLPQITATTTTENPNPKIHDHGQDLNLGCFPMTHDFKTISQLIQAPDFENDENKSRFSAMELLTGVSSRGCSNNSFMSMPLPEPGPGNIYSSGLSSLPTLNFPLEGIGNSGYGGIQESGTSGSRVLFPFEDLKQVSSTNGQNMEHNRVQQGDSTGYWNGVLGGESW